jgi:hypothetical protein
VCKVCFRSVRAGGREETFGTSACNIESACRKYISREGKTDRLFWSKTRDEEAKRWVVRRSCTAVMLQPVTLLAQFPVRPISQRPGFLGRRPSVLNLSSLYL